MIPVEPSQLHNGGRFVVFGARQRAYIPLPASVDEDGSIMTEWDLDEEERERIFMGGRIRLWIVGAVVEGKLRTPVRLEALEPTE